MTDSEKPTARTRTRILDAAERLFGEHGVKATSLRSITSEAEVNLAAINYHFGSKEGLVHEVLNRLVGPVNEERLRRLDVLLDANPKPELEEILEAFVYPPLEAKISKGVSGMRMLARVHIDGDPEFEEAFLRQFGAVGTRFFTALRQVLPQLDHETLFFRFHFCVGALVHSLMFHQRLQRVASALGVSSEWKAEKVGRHLICYMSAALRGEAPAGPDTSPNTDRGSSPTENSVPNPLPKPDKNSSADSTAAPTQKRRGE